MSKSGYATIETMDWGDTLVRVGFAIQVEEIPRENLIAVITEAVTKQLRSFVAENPKFLKTAAKARALIMERERIQENASAQSAAKPQP